MKKMDKQFESLMNENSSKLKNKILEKLKLESGIPQNWWDGRTSSNHTGYDVNVKRNYGKTNFERLKGVSGQPDLEEHHEEYPPEILDMTVGEFLDSLEGKSEEHYKHVEDMIDKFFVPKNDVPVDEGVMKDIDIISQSSKNFADFTKQVFKSYKDLDKTKESVAWLKSVYDERTNESVNETSPNIKMNNLDWGKSTAERNSNLDKHKSLKTDKEKQEFLKKLKGESVNEEMINESWFELMTQGALVVTAILWAFQSSGIKNVSDLKPIFSKLKKSWKQRNVDPELKAVLLKMMKDPEIIKASKEKVFGPRGGKRPQYESDSQFQAFLKKKLSSSEYSILKKYSSLNMIFQSKNKKNQASKGRHLTQRGFKHNQSKYESVNEANSLISLNQSQTDKISNLSPAQKKNLDKQLTSVVSDVNEKDLSGLTPTNAKTEYQKLMKVGKTKVYKKFGIIESVNELATFSVHDLVPNLIPRSQNDNIDLHKDLAKVINAVLKKHKINLNIKESIKEDLNEGEFDRLNSIQDARDKMATFIVSAKETGGKSDKWWDNAERVQLKKSFAKLKKDYEKLGGKPIKLKEDLNEDVWDRTGNYTRGGGGRDTYQGGTSYKDLPNFGSGGGSPASKSREDSDDLFDKLLKKGWKSWGSGNVARKELKVGKTKFSIEVDNQYVGNFKVNVTMIDQSGTRGVVKIESNSNKLKWFDKFMKTFPKWKSVDDLENWRAQYGGRGNKYIIQGRKIK